jgi:hypothetical protein
LLGHGNSNCLGDEGEEREEEGKSTGDYGKGGRRENGRQILKRVKADKTSEYKFLRSL